MSSTDTNQASEDELREQLADKLEWYSRYRERGQDDDMDRAFDGILALIRHEKLKLLAEVRERVVGENDYQPGNPAPDLVEHNQLVRDGLRFEQRVELNKLEAEL
jgi:hypothetical protein